MKKLVAIVSLVCFSFGITACNTIDGVGKDVEKGGEKVQDAAKSTQRKM